MVSESTAPSTATTTATTTASTTDDLGLSVHRTGPEVTLPPERPGRGRADTAPGEGEAGPAAGSTTQAPARGAAPVTDPGAHGAALVPEQHPGPPAGLQPDAEGAGRPRHRTADLAADLFRRWVAGDAGASRELVALLTPTLWHTARAYRLDAATAEDVVQNAWLALAHRQDQLRDPQAVLAWLLVTVRRDAARTAASRRAAVTDPDPVLAVTPDAAPGPATTVLDADQARRLWAAVGRLPERCQRLLRVVAFSDRPDYASLSVDLGMPVGSIGPTRGRCLKKLRDDLDGQGGWTT